MRSVTWLAHELARLIHFHPTLAEGVGAAGGGVHRPSMKD